MWMVLMSKGGMIMNDMNDIVLFYAVMYHVLLYYATMYSSIPVVGILYYIMLLNKDPRLLLDNW